MFVIKYFFAFLDDKMVVEFIAVANFYGWYIFWLVFPGWCLEFKSLVMVFGRHLCLESFGNSRVESSPWFICEFIGGFSVGTFDGTWLPWTKCFYEEMHPFWCLELFPVGLLFLSVFRKFHWMILFIGLIFNTWFEWYIKVKK